MAKTAQRQSRSEKGTMLNQRERENFHKVSKALVFPSSTGDPIFRGRNERNLTTVGLHQSVREKRQKGRLSSSYSTFPKDFTWFKAFCSSFPLSYLISPCEDAKRSRIRTTLPTTSPQFLFTPPPRPHKAMLSPEPKLQCCV